MVSQVVEFLNESIFRAFPFIEIVNFSLPWQHFLDLSEFSILWYGLWVNIDDPRYFKSDCKHLATLCDSPYSHHTRFKSLLYLYYVPIRFENNIIHISDERSEALVLCYFCVLDDLFVVFKQFTQTSPVRFLILKPVSKVFFYWWTILNLCILILHSTWGFRYLRLSIWINTQLLNGFCDLLTHVFYISENLPSRYFLLYLEEMSHILLLELVILSFELLMQPIRILYLRYWV